MGLLGIAACSDSPTDPIDDPDNPPVGTQALVITGTTLPDAVVTANVGGATYTGAADAAGQFTVSIPEGVALEAVVVLFADGSEGQSQANIRLASSLDTLQQLVNKAGADKTLDASEDAGTRITSLTTARYAMLVEVAGGQHPTTRDALLEADRRANESLNVDFLTLASLIERLVDPAATRPAGFTDTLAFALDPNAVRTYALSLQGTFESDGPISDAKRALVAQRNLFAPIADAGLSTDYESYRRQRRGSVGSVDGKWTFGASQTGVYEVSADVQTLALPTPVPFTWNDRSGSRAVSYAEPVSVDFPAVDADFVIDLVGDPSLESDIRTALADGPRQVRRSLVASELLLAPGGLAADWIVRVNRSEYAFAELFDSLGVPTIPDVVVAQEPFGTLWTAESGVTYEAFTEAEVRGQTWVLRVIGPTARADLFDTYTAGDELFTPAFVTFNDDPERTATVEHGALPVPFVANWTLTADGQIGLEYPDGTQQRFAVAERLTREDGVWTWVERPGASYFTYGIAVRLDTSAAITPDLLATPAGQYWQNTVSRASLVPEPGEPVARFERFGFIFDANGDLVRFSGFDQDNPDLPVLEDYWGWRIDDAGLLQMEGFLLPGGPQRCQGAPDCLVWRRRQWRPVALQDGFLYVLEQSIYFPLGSRFDVDVWRGPDGEVLSFDDYGYLIYPRLQAYYLEALP